jgi:hypothetical protein
LQDQIERMEADSAPTGANKRRFDDNDFVEENQQLVDGVKSAMAAGASPPALLWALVADRAAQPWPSGRRRS